MRSLATGKYWRQNSSSWEQCEQLTVGSVFVMNRHGTAIREFPNELEIVTTRKFEAPISMVFDALTKPELVSQWWATGEDTMTLSEIDLREGGEFHNIFATPTGVECSFRGRYLEIDAPHRLVNTWLFEGWPNAWATETHDLSETDGVTTLSMTTRFHDREGRAKMTRAHDAAKERNDNNGQDASWDALEDLLTSMVGNI